MAPATTIFRVFALSAALSQAAASFSLNISGPSWDYTTKDLADTTSQACKDAYSANIDCDETLLKLVASLDINFHPDNSDLRQTCTTTCKDSLDDYVKNVKATCDKDGDLAGLDNGRSLDFSVPVSTVGEVFQYMYGRGCAMNGTDYCYPTFAESDSWGSEDFSCSDNCAMKFMQNAHNQPGSGYFFFYFSLSTQSSWWEDVFAGGWKTVVKCGKGGSGSDASSVSSSVSSSKTDSVDLSSSSSTSLINGKSAVSATSTSTATVMSTSTAPAHSATATSGASRLRILFF
ncbi:hypothetical protein N7481_008888 [Penicillium waksmanii]|uniref:uncharacterized protein n=1 Tax=Penicillium waksmanii TaxID=69791 RepID=UPI0025481DAA|nr:uncharacterized protein N7481_008888 [Penicillium waksmanii]KAJ5975181.1 hypothetical protein N7481_008888 [Penicillium waksmanii]